MRQVAVKSLEEFERLFSRYSGSLAYLRDDAEKARRLVNGGTLCNGNDRGEKRGLHGHGPAIFRDRTLVLLSE